MRPRTYVHTSPTARFSRRQFDSPQDSSPYTGATGGVVPALRRLVALAMALLLLLLGQGELFAQQAPPPGQEWSRNGPYNGQYAPDQQTGGGQQPYAQQPYAATGQVYSEQGYGQAQPLNAERLQQLVAPIALYPDTLVAQVLTASTYPGEVVEADHWRQSQGSASPDQIAAGADAQTWDPSLKALTAFPQVLAQMDQNLPWTTDLGNAYYNQPQDVLEAVQVMRQRAQAAGNLQSTPQEAVSYVDGNIQLAPVNPQVVYVPTYNPWSVFGQPVSPYPGFSLFGALGSFFGSSPVSYGLGIAMTAFTNTPWGWLAWGLSWLAQAVLFHNSNYYSHSTTVADWGFPHGGQRASSGWGAIARPPNSYGNSGGGYNTSLAHGYVHRPPNSYDRPGGGYNAALARGFVPRPPNSYSPPGGGYNAALGHGFVHRPPNSYSQPGGGYNGVLARGFAPRPPNSYSGNRPMESSSRGYQASGSGYARGSQQAYNHVSSAVSRPPLADRASTARLQRPNFEQRSSAEFGSRGFAESSGKQAHLGGLHPFGGGQGSEGFRGGGHAPKSFNGGKNFSSGHSGGGGHSGGHSSGKHHH